ncbi:triose-phosphate isomerase [Methylotenera sp.]|uniref:triose-phosphate isomerase n=1 Tax=Methylotenera sp. TaxID=2051956 RepID=UPI002ED89551
MAKRRKLIVGNWKLHGSIAGNQHLLQQLRLNLKALDAVDFALCLPYVYLFQGQQLLAGSNILWGSQNVSQFEEGAYTSCISAAMIAEFGCRFVIVGHSERRLLRLDSYEVIATKLLRALACGLTPIYCVGETQQERDAGMAEVVIRQQLLNMLNALDDEALACAKSLNIVVAYEPVWAIGTGLHANPQQAQSMHVLIRQLISTRDLALAQQVRILYGGSLTADNAYDMLSMPDIDGGLLGRSSLDAEAFTQVALIANSLA